MDPTPEQILLLKAALFPGDDAWNKWLKQVDFDQIDSASHQLLPLLVLRRKDLETSDPIFSRCLGVYRQTWVANQLFIKQTESTVTQLQTTLGPLFFLKEMAMNPYYQDRAAQRIQQIDLLISKEQVSPADTQLRSLGYRSSLANFNPNKREHLARWDLVDYTREDGAKITLHWTSCHTDPGPTDLFFHSCVRPSTIQWIADSLTLLKQEIDWERLFWLAKTAHRTLSLTHAIEFLIVTFNAPIPSNILDQLKRTIPSPLERREYTARSKGRMKSAAWYRYCLNRGSTWPMLHLALYWLFRKLFFHLLNRSRNFALLV